MSPRRLYGSVAGFRIRPIRGALQASPVFPLQLSIALLGSPAWRARASMGQECRNSPHGHVVEAVIATSRRRSSSPHQRIFAYHSRCSPLSDLPPPELSPDPLSLGDEPTPMLPTEPSS